MPEGLQIFRDDGAILLDGDHRITRYVAPVYLSGQDGSVPVPGLGTVWWSFQGEAVFTRKNLDQRGTSLPRFNVSGSVLSWYYPRNAPNGAEIVNGWLFYGVY